ncbi:MAG: sugar phosphate isomerase/epimerase [Isosphaeraceae bacterium]
MKPCISQATTLTTPYEVDLPALSQSGWELVEIWLPKLEAFRREKSLEEARALIVDHGLEAPAAAGQTGLLSLRGEAHRAALEQYRRRLDELSVLGIGTLVVAADFPTMPDEGSLGPSIERLAEVASLAKARGLKIALEFQSSNRFAASLDTTLALIAQADQPNLGVCLDLFHFYTGPSKFEDLSYLNPRNLSWLQLCDLGGTPREMARDGDRILPGEGDFQVGPILDQLAAVRYDGPASLEVLNPSLWEIAADRVAPIALQALLRALGNHATGAEPEAPE